VTGTAGINLGIWAFDRYALQADYAKISLHSVKRNLKSGFVWDNDHFSTNLLGHPYQGGLYFNAARGNGMSFWQSAPYTVAGSLMWEYLMESEIPSINDFMSTPIGGVALGEITFRLSDLLIDSRTTGWERFGREALATIISPMRGLNRIFSGEAWTAGHNRGHVFAGDIPVKFYLGAGHRSLAEDSAKTRFYNGICLDLKLIYGDLFSEDHQKPYDAFMVQTSFNFFSQQPFVGKVNITGQLWGKSGLPKNRPVTLNWGFFQHFDYYDSNTVREKQKSNSYRIAEAAAFGIGGQFKAKLRQTVCMASLFLNGILLGGSITDYYRVTDRDYNLGSGFSSKFFAIWMFGNTASLSVNVEDYRIFTWKGYGRETDLTQLTDRERMNLNVQGDRGNVSFTIAGFNFNYRFGNIVVSSETSLYLRNSFYEYFPGVKYQIVESRTGVGYLF
jgi:hypothetical protein